MKLADLTTDVNSIAVQLESKYNTTVKASLTVNPEDISEFIIAFAFDTKGKPAPVPVEVGADSTPTEGTNETVS